MKKKDDRAGAAANLRKRAEEKFRADDAKAKKKLAPEETRKMLQELLVHQIELEMQNEELRRAQAELDAARTRYFDLYDLAPVGYCTVSEQGLILEANLTAVTLLGVARGTMVKQPLTRFILKEDQDIYYLHRKQLFKTGEPQAFELRMVKKDGTAFWTWLEATIAQDADGVSVCRIILSDITERKQAESQREAALEALQTAFKENRNLLGELQHRAKNSFAMILGMISLALNAGVSPETKAAIEDLGSRIRSISELYSLLYSAGSFNLVRLDEYCALIAAPLIGLSGNITLKTEMESITVPVKEAAPLGLILTELMTNAGKYAFPGGRRGTITIALKKTAAGALLEVRDDGIGLPALFDFSGSAGMGLNLVRTLSGQINGSFRMEGGAAGTRCIVEFAAANNGSQ